jgi:hypothetical protein
LIELTKENNHLKSIIYQKNSDQNSLERLEEDGDKNDKSDQMGENSTLQDLGFGPDEKDELQSQQKTLQNLVCFL